MTKRIVVALLLAAAAYLVYKQISVRDYSADCVRAANAVDEALVARGVGDSDVAAHYRRQMLVSGAKWIEFHKHVRVSLDEKMETALAAAAKKADCEIEKTSVFGGDEIMLKKSGKIFYALRFIGKPRRAAHKIAIVIDDLGYTADAGDFPSLGIPLTYAVLPRERNSARVAGFLTSSGADVLVHFPMEPEDPLVNPGRAAVTLRMDEKEIARKFDENVKTVPGAFGVSNHMGSAFTRSEAKMRVFLALAKDRGLVYFDSHTSPKSVVKKTAVSLGIPVIVNDIFLDTDDSREAIDRQLALLLKLAKKQPATVAIGHVHKKNLPQALKDFLPTAAENGIEFVPLRKLYENPRD